MKEKEEPKKNHVNPDLILAKIWKSSELPDKIQDWKNEGQTIVFTNGCFDILHRGHADYLARAADLGTRLIIGVNTDLSTRKLKGPTRPIQDEYARCFLLASFFFVDAVVLFDEDTPLRLIKQILPNILVKGSDYKPEDIVGYDILTQSGGKVVTMDFIDGYSTSGIEKKILKGF